MNSMENFFNWMSKPIPDDEVTIWFNIHNMTYEKIERLGSVQWPCTDVASEGTPTMHEDSFTRGLGQFVVTEYVPTAERCTRRFPLILTTGRILSQYNVGAQTRRTENSTWHAEDVLEIHPADAESRGISEGDWVGIASRIGDTVLRARLSNRVRPGVVYTTFHHPDTQANVITTDYSDWATNCPEYKVTAVQVGSSNGPTEWQQEYNAQANRVNANMHAQQPAANQVPMSPSVNPAQATNPAPAPAPAAPYTFNPQIKTSPATPAR